MKLGMELVLDPAPRTKRGTAPKFSAHSSCGQRVKWIAMPLATEVGLGQVIDTVLDEDPSPKKGGIAAPTFRPRYRGQTAGWINMPLGRKVGLG